MDATTRTLLVTAGTPVVSGSTYLVTTELLPAGRPDRYELVGIAVEVV